MDTDINITSFRLLAGKFFDGLISPEEQCKLFALAKSLSSTSEIVNSDDNELKDDINFLVALENAMPGAEDSVDDPTLSTRLENHIHSLAVGENIHNSSKNRFRTLRVVAPIAAAIACLVIVGASIMISQSKSSSLESAANNEHFSSVDTRIPASIPHASIPNDNIDQVQPETGKSVQPKGRTSRHSNYVAKSSSTSESDTKGDERLDVDESNDLEDNNEISPIQTPSLSSGGQLPVSTISPDPLHGLNLPLSALSAGIDNIFESMALASESFSYSLRNIGDKPEINNEPNAVSPQAI